MADELKDLPAVPQGLDDGMRRLLASMREHIRNFRGYSGDKNTAAVTPSTATSLSTIVGPPDYTAPPTPTGVSVVAGLSYLFFQTDAPSFTVGHGYDRTIVYGAKWPTGSPAPTFSSAVQIHSFIGPVGSYPTDTGTRWAIWLTWRTNDAVESTAPEGGTNGHVITTGLIASTDLGPLVVQAGNLAAGAIDATKFVAAIEPITLYTSGSLPTTKSTSTIFYGGKLYRWNGTAYVTTVPTTDLSGSITSTQIADGSITTPKLFAGSVTTSILAAHAVTANEIAANTITANELAAASVTAVKIAANAIAVGTAAIQNGAIVNAMIADATIDNAKIANLSASKITAGSLGVGSYIQSTTFTSGSVGWRIGADGVAEFNSVTIRGATYTGTIYANAGTIGGSTIGSNYMQSTSWVNGTTGWRLSSDGTGQIGAIYIDNNNIRSFNYSAGVSGFMIGYDGTIAAYQSSGSIQFNLSATGTTPVLQIGSALQILGNGSATYSGTLSAASGTFSGTLTASAVNAVDTINIAGSAVTVPMFGQCAIYQGGVAGTYTAITLPSTNLYGQSQVIHFKCDFCSYSPGGTIRITRTVGSTTTVIATWSVPTYPDTFSLTSTFMLDSPGTGSVVYKVDFVCGTSGGNLLQLNASITVSGGKR